MPWHGLLTTIYYGHIMKQARSRGTLIHVTQCTTRYHNYKHSWLALTAGNLPPHLRFPVNVPVAPKEVSPRCVSTTLYSDFTSSLLLDAPTGHRSTEKPLLCNADTILSHWLTESFFVLFSNVWKIALLCYQYLFLLLCIWHKCLKSWNNEQGKREKLRSGNVFYSNKCLTKAFYHLSYRFFLVLSKH